MRKRILAMAFVAALALTLVQQAVPSSQAKQWLVDDNKVECPKADFTSIQAAVNAAAPGDTIKVCPGQYNESVTVGKPSLTLVGATSVNINKCTTVTAADPTVDAIVTGGASPSFTLANNNITLSGFTVQGSVSGVNTSDAYAGYRITNSVFQFNTTEGINFNSSGASQSRVDHNCLRLNGPGVTFLADGVGGEIGNLSNALIDHNATYKNQGGGVDLSGSAMRAYVTVTQNSSVQDGFSGVSIDNSIGSVVSQNSTQGSLHGVTVGGSNNGLAITGNVVQGTTASGILFNQTAFVPIFPGPNMGLNVSGNTVTGSAGQGINVFETVTYSTFSNNTTSSNDANGILLQTGNDNNQVTNNGADKNGANGIYAAGAVGNTFTSNHMNLNVQYDARDDTRPANTWTANQCTTDFPAGTIC
jgi:parallel beta-helix repeat protein